MSFEKQCDSLHEGYVRGVRDAVEHENEAQDYPKMMIDWLVIDVLKRNGWSRDSITYWIERTRRGMGNVGL